MIDSIGLEFWDLFLLLWILVLAKAIGNLRAREKLIQEEQVPALEERIEELELEIQRLKARQG